MALSYLDNGILRIGCWDQNDAVFRGGSIGYFGLSGETNWVDNVDEGRQIQQSYYGDTPDYLQPEKTWGVLWAWNPTQTKGLPLAFTNDGTTIYSKCNPFDWASSPEIFMTDCIMEQWTTLEGNVAKVRCRLTYTGPPQGSAGIHVAEAPAIFLSNGNLTLYTYEGASPWTGDTLTTLYPGGTNQYRASTERWWAYGDDTENLGLGIYVPIATPFLDAYQLVTMNMTCYRVAGISYLAPLVQVNLLQHGTYEYVYYLTVADVPTIRSRFDTLRQAGADQGAGWAETVPPTPPEIVNQFFIAGSGMRLSQNGALSIGLPDGRRINVDASENNNPVQLVLPNGKTLGLGR
jgi:hypothetical protein